MEQRLDAPENLHISTNAGTEQAPGRVLENNAPEFTRWRRILFKVNLLIAAVVFLLEAVIVMLLYNGGLPAEQLPEHILRYMIIPSAVNAAALCAEFVLMKRFTHTETLQNAIVLMTMTVISTVAASVHYAYEDTMALFCIPILTSAVFYNKKLTLATAAANTCGFAVSTAFRYAGTFGKGLNDRDILPEVVIAAAVILISLHIAEIIVMLMSEQENKLIKVVSEANAARQEASDANNAKSSFLANMSHEIRTPINAILGMNEMILREEHNAAIREYAGNIQSSGNLLLSVINDVLDISKIESGNIEIISSDYNISSLINDCYIMSASRAREKDLTLNVECSEVLPRLLSGDEAHIRQIVVNLLTNAVKYTEKGSITLSAGGERDGNIFMLTVSVSDTGIGISEENLG